MPERTPERTPVDRVLWGVGTSRTIRAHWALAELDLAYRCEPIQARSGETQTDRFGAINPRRKIPVLVDGGFRVAESAAIINYLSATYGMPGRRLVPVGVRERARYDEWCFFIMTELDATSLYIVRRHVGLAHIYGEAPVAVEAAIAYFRRHAETVAASLEDGRPWLLGDTFSGADMLLSTCLDWAARSEVPLGDSLERFRGRIAARPAFAAARAANQPSHWAANPGPENRP